MKALVLFVVGLGAGALLATSLIGALAARDRYPKAVMVVLQANLGALQRGLRQRDCGLDEAAHHVAQLAALTREIPRAFPALERDSAEFVRARELLAEPLDAALAMPPADCEALNRTVSAAAQACEACHNAFR